MTCNGLLLSEVLEKRNTWLYFNAMVIRFVEDGGFFMTLDDDVSNSVTSDGLLIHAKRSSIDFHFPFKWAFVTGFSPAVINLELSMKN